MFSYCLLFYGFHSSTAVVIMLFSSSGTEKETRKSRKKYRKLRRRTFLARNAPSHRWTRNEKSLRKNILPMFCCMNCWSKYVSFSNYYLTHQVPGDKCSLVSHMVSVRPSGKQKQAKTLKQNTGQHYMGPGGSLNSHFLLQSLSKILGSSLSNCTHVFEFCKQCNITVIDPPGHGRIGGHYFHTWCPYVRTSVRPKNKNTLQR